MSIDDNICSGATNQSLFTSSPSSSESSSHRYSVVKLVGKDSVESVDLREGASDGSSEDDGASLLWEDLRGVLYAACEEVLSAVGDNGDCRGLICTGVGGV